MTLIIGGAPAPAGTPGTPTPPAQQPAPGTPAPDAITYPESFPEEFHGNDAVTKFYDQDKKEFNYGNMMTSLIHAQKLVGGDKILAPNKDSSPEDWNTIFKKLGLPGREEYKLGIEGVDETADDMTKGFMDVAHNLGVLPKQAKGIVEYFNEAQKQQETQGKQDSDDANTQALNQLKEDWKGTYEDNINVVNETISKLFTADEQKIAQDAGYFSDPVFVKMMHSVSSKLMDDTTLTGQGPSIGGIGGEQALRDEYQTVMGKLSMPEHKNSPALNRRLTVVLEQAAKKGIEIYR